jgi:hypothetical protein
MPLGASRADRSHKFAQMKKDLARLPKVLDCFQIAQPLRGANDSSQYVGAVQYISRLGGQVQTLQLEFSLREPLQRPAANAPAATLLLDPISDKPAVAPLTLRCLDPIEALAEKFRAALTRREPAIRDYYDIAHAAGAPPVRPLDDKFLDLIRIKLAVPGNDPVNIGPDRLAQLQTQLQGRLKPVLRQHDFDAFNLDDAFNTVTHVAQALAGG